MKKFFRENGILLLIAAVLLSVLITLCSSFFGSKVDPLGSALNTLATPVRGGINAVVNWVEGVYDYVFHYEQMEDELTQLRRRVAEMEDELRQARYARGENQRLRGLLELREQRRDFVFESAQVNAHGTRGWDDTLTISKGSTCDIEVGDCVITETGVLVGVVSQVGLNWATVDTVLSPNTELGGQTVRASIAGVLSGELDLMQEGLLKLGYLPLDHGIIEGDEVVTTGRGGVYPAGLVVGTVTEIGTDEAGLSGHALVKPAVRLDKLTQVFVIKEFDIVE